VRFYESFGQKAIEAVGHYVHEVKAGEFPVEGEHTYPMTDIELQKFKQVMENRRGGKN
jgi:ketopantoate hydroxymethyltransferase